jgi:hypothetical protein
VTMDVELDMYLHTYPCVMSEVFTVGY